MLGGRNNRGQFNSLRKMINNLIYDGNKVKFKRISGMLNHIDINNFITDKGELVGIVLGDGRELEVVN